MIGERADKITKQQFFKVIYATILPSIVKTWPQLGTAVGLVRF